MTRPTVEVVVDTKALIGESPRWDEEAGVLRWVDVLRGEVHRTDPSSGSDRVLRLGTSVGAVAVRRGGGLVVAAGDGFAILDDEREDQPVGAPATERGAPGGGRLRWLWRLGAVDVAACGPGGLAVRMNDATCDATGRLWGGTMTVDRQPGAAHLYRLDPDGSVAVVLDGVTLSNGLGFGHDGRTLAYIDTPCRRVDVFEVDVDAGTLHGRRPLVEIEDGAGNPDGLAVDADGCLWVALAHGGVVRRYTPAGRLDAVVELPVRKVTSCAFGGPRLDMLFVTSACVALTEQELVDQPLAGAVLACEVGTTGVPAHRFGG